MFFGFSRTQLVGTLVLSSALLMNACAKPKSAAQGPASVPPEAYCPYLPSLTFSGGITVTGTARYEYRVNGNGAIANRVIRYAEVAVTNGAGAIVQCAEVDGSGNFTFQLPLDGASYTVAVRSRANNATTRAYVMTDPTNNTYYSVSTTITANVNQSVSLITRATGDVISGAFNILDQIVGANKFLATNTTACGAMPYPNCTPFTVAPLAYVYWKKGFNPNTYMGGASNNGVSFYLRGTNELYILGGIAGDVDHSDTDHFDNSIIVHEYGHFIENYYSMSDSPGGRHYANSTIDPRLAWSEAYANFFQAAVLNNPLYRDTEGNISGTTSAFHDENLENYDSYDNPALIDPGAGHFHEFSLTRALWDGFDSNNDGETVQANWAEYWEILTTPAFWMNSNYKFRDAGLFNKLWNTNPNRQTNWSSIYTNEDQKADRRDYATPLTVPAGAACTKAIQPDAWSEGTYDASDQFYDNDFYAYYHPGGTLHVKIDYTVGVNPVNLDLILWKDGYFYGDTSDIAGASTREQTADSGTEDVSVSVPAGWYMIDVMADNSALVVPGSPSNYNLWIYNSSGVAQRACPNP